MFGGNYFAQYRFVGLLFNFTVPIPTGWQMVTKVSTTFTKSAKSSTTWTKIAKTT